MDFLSLFYGLFDIPITNMTEEMSGNDMRRKQGKGPSYGATSSLERHNLTRYSIISP